MGRGRVRVAGLGRKRLEPTDCRLLANPEVKVNRKGNSLYVVKRIKQRENNDRVSLPSRPILSGCLLLTLLIHFSKRSAQPLVLVHLKQNIQCTITDSVHCNSTEKLRSDNFFGCCQEEHF